MHITHIYIYIYMVGLFYDLHTRKLMFVTLFISNSGNSPVQILARFAILCTLHECHQFSCQQWPHCCRHGLTGLFDKASFNRHNTTSKLALDFPQYVMFLILIIVESATDFSAAFLRNLSIYKSTMTKPINNEQL
jgi:hypothetical protein